MYKNSTYRVINPGSVVTDSRVHSGEGRVCAAVAPRGDPHHQAASQQRAPTVPLARIFT